MAEKKDDLRVRIEHLTESERKFRSVFESMEEGVALHEILYDDAGVPFDYRIIDVNPSFEANTGMPAGKIRGRTARESYGTGDAPFLDIYAQVALTGKPQTFETFFAPLERYFRVSAFSPKKGWFATVFSDITERKRLEEDRNEAYRKIEHQHTLFSGIIDSAISGIFSLDRGYSYTSFNSRHKETMKAIYGTDIREGQSILDSITIEKDRKAMKREIDRAIAGETIIAGDYYGDNALSRQYMEPSFNPIRSPEGEIIGVAVISRDATEKKKAEKALRASEERYRRLAENSPDIIFRLSLPGHTFEYVSPAAEMITGYEPDEYYKNPLLLQEIIHPDYKERLDVQWDRMPNGDVPGEYEYQIIHKSGESRWLHQRNTVVRDNTGRAVALEGIVTDITGRKKAEIALRKMDEQYRLIAENTGDVIWILNLETGRFPFVSPSVFNLLGYTAEEFASIGLNQILTEESREYIRKILPGTIAALHSGDEKLRVQTHHLDQIRKDGSVVAVEIVATLLKETEAGRTEILGVSRDISERKKAHDALRESEEKFRSLVETTSDLVWEIDSRGVYTYVSPKVREMLGYEPEELLQKSPLEIMPEDERERLTPLLNKAIALQQPVSGIENRCLKKDGSEVVMESSAVPRFAEDGSFAGLRGIDRDISERKKVQDALGESEERYRTLIESANEAIFVIQEGIIPFCNAKGLDLIGYDPGYLKTHSFLDLVHPDDRAAAYDRHMRRLNGEIINPLAEIRILDSGGEMHWIEINAVLVPWNGRPATLNFATDITERRKADDALRESERSYHGLFNSVREAIYIQDREGHFLNVNDGAVEMYGYPREFFIGKTPAILAADQCNDLEKLNICMELAFEGKPQYFEFWGKRSNGEVFPKDVRLYKGTYFGKDVLIAIATEITERKRAEAALRESEQHYHLLADNVSDVIWTAGREMELTYVSPSVTALTGYTPEEFLNLRPEQCLTPESFQNLVQTRAENISAFQRGECDFYQPQVLELEYIRKDKTPFWAEVVISLIRTSDGEPQGVIGVTRDISERRRTQEALRESEEKFRELVEHSTDVIYTIDFRGFLTSISPAVLQIMGYRPEELIGKNISAYLSPESLVRATEEIERKKENTEASSLYEVQLRAADGSWKSFEVNSRLRMREGRPLDILGIARDITERKQVEEALRNSENYLKTIVNSIQTGLVIIEPDTHIIVDINPAAQQMIGHPREKIIGSVCHQYICPTEAGNCPVTDLGQSVDNTERTLITAGGTRSILKTVIPTEISGRKYLLESFIDITDRKRAEAQVSESEEKFRLIFKNSNDAIYLFEITPAGMPGRIADANEVALLHTGLTKESLTKKTFLEIHSPDLPPRSRAIMMELLTKGRVRFETDVARKDTTKLPVEVSAQFAKLNQKTYVIAISRDISRRKREDRALRIANQKLQLMNIVAWHDIQNKVTGLRGYVELSKDLVTDDQMKKFIHSEEEVLKVIHQQLQYTKEYQEMGVHPQEWVNLNQTLRMILSLAELGRIQMLIEVGDLEIFCDPVIAKVFSHLIDNTKVHGQKATRIHISCYENADGLVLVYEDDGVGIPDEQKKELFLRNVGAPTGFSLFFIHDLLEVSEMTIRETGVHGEGVRFEIGIPRGIYRFGHTND